MKIRRATMEDCAGIARVQVASYRTAYAGIYPADVLASFTIEEQTEDWRTWMTEHPEDILFVAEDDQKVVGYALARAGAVCDHDSELIALHVNPHAHRLGIGRHLVSAVARELRGAGCRSMMLWTLEQNAARGFYERLGATLLNEHKQEGSSPPEVAYGWPDLSHL
jgi:ribosomal protein S18 acetylase RimI-like enzyme